MAKKKNDVELSPLGCQIIAVSGNFKQDKAARWLLDGIGGSAYRYAERAEIDLAADKLRVQQLRARGLDTTSAQAQVDLREHDLKVANACVAEVTNLMKTYFGISWAAFGAGNRQQTGGIAAAMRAAAGE